MVSRYVVSPYFCLLYIIENTTSYDFANIIGYCIFAAENQLFHFKQQNHEKKLMLLVMMLCIAFVGANAQNGGNGNGNGNGSGNGNGQPTQTPIHLNNKGECTSDPEGLIGTAQLPVFASYTSDSLFIDVTDYSGVMVVAVVNTFTNQTVLQTIEHISATSSSVEIDISALSHATYRVDIYLANEEGYEGYFEIE